MWPGRSASRKVLEDEGRAQDEGDGRRDDEGEQDLSSGGWLVSAAFSRTGTLCPFPEDSDRSTYPGARDARIGGGVPRDEAAVGGFEHSEIELRACASREGEDATLGRNKTGDQDERSVGSPISAEHYSVVDQPTFKPSTF